MPITGWGIVHGLKRDSNFERIFWEMGGDSIGCIKGA